MSRFKSLSTLIVVLGLFGWAAPASAQALSLNIGPTLNGALGANSFFLQASGGTAPYHYSITPGFTPPAGFRVQDGPPLPTNFTVSPSGTGGFLGVATTSGTFTTSIRVTDAAATVLDKPITLNIPPLQFPVYPPKMTVGVAVFVHLHRLRRIRRRGILVVGDKLAGRLELSASGVLSGTPGQSLATGRQRRRHAHGQHTVAAVELVGADGADDRRSVCHHDAGAAAHGDRRRLLHSDAQRTWLHSAVCVDGQHRHISEGCR